MTTPTPHPNAEILRAIADGKIVQYSELGQLWSDWSNKSYEPNPFCDFAPQILWRVKTERKPDIIVYGFLSGDVYSGVIRLGMYKEDSDFMRITVDGETGEPKSVELI
jgi:hypothetical protein